MARNTATEGDAASTNGGGGVWRVPAGGGSATLVSDFGNPGQGPTGNAPISGAAAASAARTVEPGTDMDRDRAAKDKDGESCLLVLYAQGCKP